MTARVPIGICVVAVLLIPSGTAGAETPPACTPPSGISFPLLGERSFCLEPVSKADPNAEPSKVSLTLTESTDGALHGSLTYERTGVPIRVLGCVDAERRFLLEELDVRGEVTGRLLGWLGSDHYSMRGTWVSVDGKHSYDLRESSHCRLGTAPPGLVCDYWTDLERVESGDFEPLSAAEARRSERAPLVAFGPYDRAGDGFRRVLVTYAPRCPPEEEILDWRRRHNDNPYPCPYDVRVGIDGDAGTTWFRRFFAPDDEDCYGADVIVAEAADPDVPRVKVATKCVTRVNYTTGHYASNYLIDFVEGRPRATWRQRCFTFGGGRDGPPEERPQSCAWDRKRADFLCREELERAARHFWLESETPVGPEVGDATFYPSLARFLESVGEDPLTADRPTVIRGIGKLEPIGSFALEGGGTTRLFTAPDPRFYALVSGSGRPASWTQIPASRFRFGENDRNPVDPTLRLVPHHLPVAEGYTPEAPRFRSQARSIETGIEGLHLLQVLTGDVPSGEVQFITERFLHDEPLSLHWIVADVRGGELRAQALLLISRDVVWSRRGVTPDPRLLARVIDIESGRGERLARLTVAPPSSPQYDRPEATPEGYPCPVDVSLEWTGRSGLRMTVSDVACEESDYCFGEPRIGKDRTFTPGASTMELATELYDLWVRDDLRVAVDRARRAFRNDSKDRKNACVSVEMDAFIERLGVEGTPEEILTFLAWVGKAGDHPDLFFRAAREASDRDTLVQHLRGFLNDRNIPDRFRLLSAQLDTGSGRRFVAATDEALEGLSGDEFDALREKTRSALGLLRQNPPTPRMTATVKLDDGKSCDAPHPYRFAPLRAAEIRSITFSPDGEQGWALDHDGAILTLSADRTRWDLVQPVLTTAGVRAAALNGAGGAGWAFTGDGTIVKLEAWPLEQLAAENVERFRLTVSDGWNVSTAVAEFPRAAALRRELR